MHRFASIIGLGLLGCGAAADARSVEPSPGPPGGHDDTRASAEPAAPGAAAPAPAPPATTTRAELATFCKESCERNGQSCSEIDVPGCIANCETAFGSVTEFCPKRLAAFTSCVQRDPLRCEAGAKIRPAACGDQSDAMTMCLLLFAMPEASRCAGPCEDEGKCHIDDGACVATPESCAKLERCQGARCVVADGACRTE